MDTPVEISKAHCQPRTHEEESKIPSFRPLKIAIDASPAAERERGGIPHYVLNIVNHLAKIDEENEYFLCYRLSRLKKRRYFLKTGGRSFKTKIIQDPFNFFFSKRIDIFHGTDSRLPRFKHAKKVVTIHDLFSVISSKFANARFRYHKINRYYEAIERADLIIADSMNTQRDLVERLEVPRSKIRVIHLGVESKFYPRSEEQIHRVRKKYGLKREYLLYVGTLSRRKNIGRILRAFTRLCRKSQREIDLVMAGYLGYGGKEFLEVLERMQVRDSIHHLGYVEDSDLPALYSGAEVFVFPSLYEGFGLPVLEALACGTPVLSSNNSSIPEVAEDAALLVDPMDEEAIAQGILRIMEDRDLREQLVQDGLNRARNFSWRKTARKTLEVYRELAS